MSRQKKINNAELPTSSITKNEKQKMIEDVLSEFDFEKIHKVMEFLNWTYYIDGLYPEHVSGVPVSERSISTRIPSAEYLKDFARGLLIDVLSMKNRCDTISCGGFTAAYDARYGELKLEFTIESLSRYSDNL